MRQLRSMIGRASLVTLGVAALILAVGGCQDDKTDSEPNAQHSATPSSPRTQAPETPNPPVADSPAEGETDVAAGAGQEGGHDGESAGGGGLLSALGRLMGDDDDQPAAAVEGWDGKYHMACLNPKCGHTFELSDDDKLMKMMEAGTAHPGPEGVIAKCPKCEKMSGTEKMRCPECGKYYVSQVSRHYLLTNQYNPELPNACPHCEEE